VSQTATRIVLYGKGGIGKSTVGAHLSMAYAQAGQRVLHVGCDPKMDSSLRLTEQEDVPTIVDFIEDRSLVRRTPAELIVRGKAGIDTIETGGPEPGLGCAGRGVATLFDFLDQHKVMTWPYDLMLFDVLGDLVCGGFVAPLRYGMGDRVVIVASGELMALYAANNIARVVLHHVDEGVHLAGIVYNVKVLDDRVRSSLDHFAHVLGARVLAYIPWDPRIKEAERANRTVLETHPDSEPAQLFRDLAQVLAAPLPADLPTPTPLERKAFMRLGRELDL